MIEEWEIVTEIGAMPETDWQFLFLGMDCGCGYEPGSDADGYDGFWVPFHLDPENIWLTPVNCLDVKDRRAEPEE